MGDTKKFQGDMTFLLIAPRKTIEGEMAFRLAMVWVYPYQAYLSSLDEATKELTLLINLCDNWAYTFCAAEWGCLTCTPPQRGSS